MCSSILFFCGSEDSTPSAENGDGSQEDQYLYASPPKLGFKCINLGCKESKVLTLTNVRKGKIEISNILFSEETSKDFAIGFDQKIPLVLKGGEHIELTMGYVPNDPAPDRGELIIKYRLLNIKLDQKSQFELAIPLVTRSIGIPKMKVDTDEIDFSFVKVGSKREQNIAIENLGTGNAVLSIEKIGFSEDSIVEDLTIEPPAPPAQSVAVNDKLQVKLIYTPKKENFIFGHLIINSNDQNNPLHRVKFFGSSYTTPYMQLTAPEKFIFSETQVRELLEINFQVANMGEKPLQISGSISAASPEEAANFLIHPPLNNPITIKSFNLQEFSLRYLPKAAGKHLAELTIVSNDPNTPETKFALEGIAIDPQIEVTPAKGEFGQIIAEGNTEAEMDFSIKNVGKGPLQITDITLTADSSKEFQLGTLPGLPVTLNQGNEIKYLVKYTTSGLGESKGKMIIKNSTARNGELLVPLSATSVSCKDGCQLPNGQPECTSGKCAIKECNSDFFDLDLEVQNGCECADEADDPKGTCTEGRYLGTLSDKDQGSSISITGIILPSNDEDIFKFFAEDDSDWFSDEFEVKLAFTPPPDSDLKMCYKYEKRDDHQDTCSSQTWNCSSNTFSRKGSTGKEDSADVFVRIFSPGGMLTCDYYTLEVSNNK